MTTESVSVPVLVVLGVLSELSRVVGHSACKENSSTQEFDSVMM